MSVIVKCCGGENVTPEVTAQTPIIVEMAEKFGVSITTPSGSNKQILQGNNSNLQSISTNAKKAGAHAWKKYKIFEETLLNPSFSFDARTDSKIYPISSDSFDTSKVSESFFDGFSFTLNVDGTIYTQSFVYADGSLHAIGGYFGSSATDSNRFVYDAQNSKFTGSSIGTTRTLGTATYTGEKVFSYNSFQSFAVSDNYSEYPDGGTQDGYWYERFENAAKGIDFGYVTLTRANSAITVAHSLGKVPSGAMITLIEGTNNDSTQRTQSRLFFGNINTDLYRNSNTFVGLYSIYNSISELYYPFNADANNIEFTRCSSLNFKAGKYLWIVIE